MTQAQLMQMVNTEILLAAKSTGRSARGRLIDAAYKDLRRIAGAKMAQERTNHTLSPTALVNEISMRLMSDGNVPTEDRGRFFAYAARAMRNHLIDHARAKGRFRRGGDREQVSINEEITAGEDEQDLLALHEALEVLAESEPRQAQVVELRYFGGLGNAEIAFTPGDLDRDRQTRLGGGEELAQAQAWRLTLASF